MAEAVFCAIVISFIFQFVPATYKSGEEKKNASIKKGKVYYGFFRMIGLYLLAFMTSEMILLILLGDSVSGSAAFLMTVVLSVFVMIWYLKLYDSHYEKLIKEYKKKKRTKK